MKKSLLIALAVVALAAIAWFWFGTNNAVPAKMPAPEVVVQPVTLQDVPLTYEYAGRMSGVREIEIRPRVSGILEKRSYQEGSPVKEGDILFTIDQAPFKADLSRAQAQMTQAQRDWERAEALFAEKALSPREYDATKSAFEQARAALATARINLGYTVVRAPISGITSREGFSEGSLVTANTSLLTRISQLDQMYIDFAIPDQEYASQRLMLSQGKATLPEGGKLEAEIHLSDGSVFPQIASVNFTDSIIDQQTGTVHARATVENTEGILLPGQFIRVLVKGLTLHNAVIVPDSSIMQGPQGVFIYTVITSGTTVAGMAPVKLGPLTAKGRVIEEGLKTGDRIITAGMIKILPGAAVTVGSNPSPTTSASISSSAPQKE